MPSVLYLVAPHAGAWIETNGNASGLRVADVAPHAGAWIETNNHDLKMIALASRPPRGGVD